MSSVVIPNASIQSLKDPQFKEKLQSLRRTDNVTNIWYVLRTYLFLVATIGGAIWFYYFQAAAGLSFLWNIPVTILAIIFVGAGQHQLTALSHEAAHHILFKNRLLNDLVSDWLCMFPLFSSTMHYRLQHLAHHQFVNDPDRDPDVSQLETSGHWLDFPLAKGVFLKTLLKQLWIPNLIRYMRIRARYNAIPTEKNPYLKKGWKPSKIPVRVGVFYLLAQVALLTGLVWTGQPLLLAIVPTALWIAVMIFYAVIPAKLYHQSRIHPVISSRAMTLMRMTYTTALFIGLAWISLLVDPWAVMYYFLLWAAPIFTSFSFFMILRQIVQHGNGDRGWLTNTRIFHVNPLLNFAVFPLGQDYHLPHHLFASIPHYRLKQLHEVLMQCEEYRNEAVVVEGYFTSRTHPPTNPTVVEVLGPEYHHRADDVYIDNEVLDNEEVEDKEEILRQGEEEKHRRHLSASSPAG